MPESFTSIAPTQMEENLNEVGYNLLNVKKTSEAIEIFKMNVKLFPKSWNTYDSLADGYEAAGQYKLAIENFEKSMELNPKSRRKDKIMELKRK